MSRFFARGAGCALVAALALAVLVAPGAVEGKVTPRAKTVTIKVTASDYKFALSAKSAKPGKVTFKIKNAGATAHDFSIDGKTSALIGPGASTSLTVTFKKKGKFPYLCTVPGHAQLGMKGTFTVT